MARRRLRALLAVLLSTSGAVLATLGPGPKRCELPCMAAGFRSDGAPPLAPASRAGPATHDRLADPARLSMGATRGQPLLDSAESEAEPTLHGEPLLDLSDLSTALERLRAGPDDAGRAEILDRLLAGRESYIAERLSVLSISTGDEGLRRQIFAALVRRAGADPVLEFERLLDGSNPLPVQFAALETLETFLRSPQVPSRSRSTVLGLLSLAREARTRIDAASSRIGSAG